MIEARPTGVAPIERFGKTRGVKGKAAEGRKSFPAFSFLGERRISVRLSGRKVPESYCDLHPEKDTRCAGHDRSWLALLLSAMKKRIAYGFLPDSGLRYRPEDGPV